MPECGLLLTSSLALDLKNRCVYYGVDGSAAGTARRPEISDATHCIRCKTEYGYDYVTYGHLGGFAAQNAATPGTGRTSP